MIFYILHYLETPNDLPGNAKWVWEQRQRKYTSHFNKCLRSVKGKQHRPLNFHFPQKNYFFSLNWCQYLYKSYLQKPQGNLIISSSPQTNVYTEELPRLRHMFFTIVKTTELCFWVLLHQCGNALKGSGFSCMRLMPTYSYTEKRQEYCSNY